jgi:hypothetical protein
MATLDDKTVDTVPARRVMTNTKRVLAETTSSSV